MIRKAAIILLFSFLLATPTSTAQLSRFYIWNVGQGQWATWVQHSTCVHFDIGGEYAPLQLIRQHCQNKDNPIFISHSDLDHIQFLKWARKNLKQVCIAALPRENLNPRKKKIFAGVKICKPKPLKQIIELTTTNYSQSDSNSLSRVFVAIGFFSSILVPGDSTAAAEKNWARYPENKSHINKSTRLILGHHGSKTSTSEALLKALPNLQMAFCSARKKRYGHPHAIISHKMQKRLSPLLPTEIWGTISFDF